MRFSSPFRNRNYADPAARPVESEVDELRRRVEGLESLVSRLQRERDGDEPMLERLRWRFGPPSAWTAAIAIVVAGLVWLGSCAR